MASTKSDFGYQVGTIIGDMIGWAFCLAIAVGIFSLGFWLAPLVGMTEHRDALGILAVISTIWMYEHQVAHERWTKLMNSGLNS
jgi:hypothetical protein